MLVSVKGYYEAGKVTLTEEPPVTAKTEVVVVFPTDEKNGETKKRKLGTSKGLGTIPNDFNEPLNELPIPNNAQGKIRLGSLEGQIIVPDDFNEPLDELKDYM